MNIFKKKNKLIYIFLVAIFASVTTTPSISKAYSVEEVELKRDLIEELKSKYNLDPENNPKDQCDLMFELRDYIVGYATERPNESSLCEKNGICLKALSFASIK